MAENNGPAAPTKGERTRERIQSAVISLVNEAPLSEIKIADICARAGLAVGAFYFHFRGKDHVLEITAIEILHRFFSDLVAYTVSDDLHSEIYGIISEFYRGYIENRLGIRAVYRILGAHPPVRLAWLEARAALIDRLVQTFARARPPAKAAFQSDYVLAQFLLSALERFYEEVFFAPSYQRLYDEAANFDVFVRQQARVWHRAVTGQDPPRT